MGVIWVQILNGIDLVDQALVAQRCEHFADFSAINGLHDALLEIDREPFVQPKVIPCGVRDEVATPAVCQFVGHQGHQ